MKRHINSKLFDNHSIEEIIKDIPVRDPSKEKGTATVIVKLTIDELREQFEEFYICSYPTDDDTLEKFSNNEYIYAVPTAKWNVWLECAKANNILKESE